MPYALQRDRGPKGTPSLQEMTSQAMKVLSRHRDGYVLMVEGGRIDHGHHANYAQMALHEAAELDDAVAYAAGNTNPADTLIIVTADHSHAFTINGYPKRGNDILGKACNKIAVGLPASRSENLPGNLARAATSLTFSREIPGSYLDRDDFPDGVLVVISDPPATFRDTALK
jgi:alkaline phosphatase